MSEDDLTILAGGGDDAPAEKKVRKRKRRDTSAPKQPSSAMQLYIDHNKTALKAEEPTLSTMDANKRLAENWKGLVMKDRSEFVKKALQDKARYDEETATYEPTAFRSTKSGNRLAKDPKRPKKPKTAYLCFADKHRADLFEFHPGQGASKSFFSL